MAKLSDLGFQKGAISETIVATYNSDGSPNAAPMGASLQDEQHLAIILYNSSKTLVNIKNLRCATVNLTSTIEVYFRTAFKETNPDDAVPDEWFIKSQVANAPKLRLAEATIDVSLVDLLPHGAEKTKAFFRVEQVKAEKGFPKVYCRAFGVTIEAIIHATRVKALSGNSNEQDHVRELLRKIADCNEIVGRVAPNSSYSAVMADLMKRIGAWIQE